MYYTGLLLEESTRQFVLLCDPLLTAREWYTPYLTPDIVPRPYHIRSTMLALMRKTFALPDDCRIRQFTHTRTHVFCTPDYDLQPDIAFITPHERRPLNIVTWDATEFERLSLHPALQDTIVTSFEFLKSLSDEGVEITDMDNDHAFVG